MCFFYHRWIPPFWGQAISSGRRCCVVTSAMGFWRVGITRWAARWWWVWKSFGDCSLSDVFTIWHYWEIRKKPFVTVLGLPNYKSAWYLRHCWFLLCNFVAVCSLPFFSGGPTSTMVGRCLRCLRNGVKWIRHSGGWSPISLEALGRLCTGNGGIRG